MSRHARVERTTSETKIVIALELDPVPGRGESAVAAVPVAPAARTGHGFLDHLLEQLLRHGRLGLMVEAEGDLHIDVHHLAEDCGIVLGQALSEALGDRLGIERYGNAFAPMDETLAHVVIDLSGRPHLSFDPAGPVGDAGGFNTYHLREFLRGFANHAGATLHVRLLSADEVHHACEAIMKAFARALHGATRVTHDALPSTKGLL